MASMATAIQYTIRMNLSVTIVAMVNQSFVQHSSLAENEFSFNESNFDVSLRPVIKKTISGCPAVSSFNDSLKSESTEAVVNVQQFKVRIEISEKVFNTQEKTTIFISFFLREPSLVGPLPFKESSWAAFTMVTF